MARAPRRDLTLVGAGEAVFYGAAILIVIDLGFFFWRGIHGIDALAFFIVLALGLFSMWRVWKDEHSYSLE